MMYTSMVVKIVVFVLLPKKGSTSMSLKSIQRQDMPEILFRKQLNYDLHVALDETVQLDPNMMTARMN